MDDKRQDIERIEAFMQAGDPAGAEAYCRERLATATADGQRILLLDYLVNLLLAGQRPEEAEQACREELALLEKMFGPDHPHIAGALHNLGMLLNGLGRFDEAMTHSARELEILQKALPPDHPRLADAKLGLANHYYETSRFDEAAALLKEALASFEAAEGRESLGVSACLNNLGRILENQGENESGIPLFAEAAAIRRKLLGRHPETAFTLLNYGTALVAVGRIYDAANVLAECAALYAHLDMNDSPLCKACLSNLELCRREIGRLSADQPGCGCG